MKEPTILIKMNVRRQLSGITHALTQIPFPTGTGNERKAYEKYLKAVQLLNESAEILAHEYTRRSIDEQ